MKFYIIPGYSQKMKDYDWLVSKVKKKYDVEFLNLQLKNNSLLRLSKTKVEPNSIVFGFSTGALIAYKLKTKVKKEFIVQYLRSWGMILRGLSNT